MVICKECINTIGAWRFVSEKVLRGPVTLTPIAKR